MLWFAPLLPQTLVGLLPTSRSSLGHVNQEGGGCGVEPAQLELIDRCANRALKIRPETLRLGGG